MTTYWISYKLQKALRFAKALFVVNDANYSFIHYLIQYADFSSPDVLKLHEIAMSDVVNKQVKEFGFYFKHDSFHFLDKEFYLNRYITILYI